LTNTAQAATAVTVMLSGWITAPRDDGARLQPASGDLGSVKAGKTRTLTRGIPADAEAVVLAVTTKGAAKAGGVTVWGAGEQPSARSVDVRAKRANTDLVLVTLGADKAVRVAGKAPKATVSVRMVGVIR